MRRIPRIDRPEWDRTPANEPSVSVIVPARNEADTIEPALQSLMQFEYAKYEVIAVNDRSTDATGEIMQRFALDSNGRLKVIHVDELPNGWLGKTHAMWKAAQESSADWLLFTDADVVFKPDTLRRAFAYLEIDPADHLVLFPTMEFRSFGEKVVLGFFVIMFGFAHKPWKVADPKSKEHVGMGAFNLVRRSVYQAIGTYQRMRLAVVDDVKLGELVKKSGHRQRNVFGRNLIRVHWASGAFGIMHNLTKNFFSLLHFRAAAAVLVTAVMLFVNIMPFVGIVWAPWWAKAPFAAALIAIVLIYVSVKLEEPESPWWLVVLHPIGALMLAYAILRSAFVTLRDGGITWRGTKYSLHELREGMK